MLLASATQTGLVGEIHNMSLHYAQTFSSDATLALSMRVYGAVDIAAGLITIDPKKSQGNFKTYKSADYEVIAGEP